MDNEESNSGEPDKVICAACKSEIKTTFGTIPGECPECGTALSLVNLRCLDSGCKGNTLIIEPAGCGIPTTVCPVCNSSEELYETENPLRFTDELIAAALLS